MSPYYKNSSRAIALALLLMLLTSFVFGCRDDINPSSSAGKSSSRSSSQTETSSVPASEPESVVSVPSRAPVSSQAPPVSSPPVSRPVPSVSPSSPSETTSSEIQKETEVKTENVRVTSVNPILNFELTFHYNSPKPTPIAILFHGGNWSTKANSDTEAHSYTKLGNLEKYKDKLVESGFAVASCQYIRDVSTAYPSPGKSPAPVNNAELIIKFILSLPNAADYFYNPEQVILIGENAGGYTALMSALTGKKYYSAAGKEINISAVIAISSILDLEDLMKQTAVNNPELDALQNAAEDFVGVPYDASAPAVVQKYINLSPAALLAKENIPLCILGVLNSDLQVYQNQSLTVTTANPDVFRTTETTHPKLWENIKEIINMFLSFDDETESVSK